MITSKLIKRLLRAFAISGMFLFFTIPAYSQVNINLDSLYNQIKNSDTIEKDINYALRVKNQFKLWNAVYSYNFISNKLEQDKDYKKAALLTNQIAKVISTNASQDTAGYYTYKSIELANKSGDGKAIISSTIQLITYATTFQLDVNIDSLINYATKAIESDDNIKLDVKRLELANLYKTTGTYYLIRSNSSKALEFFEYSLNELDMLETESKRIILAKAHLNFNIGFQFYKSGYDGRAKTILLDAARTLRSQNTTDYLGNCYTLLGAVYKKETQYDSALYYFNLSYKVYSHVMSTSKAAGAMENIGIVYKDLKQLDKAMEAFETSLEMRKELKSPKSLVGLYVNMSNVFIQQKKYDKAEKLLFEAIDISIGVKGLENALSIAYKNMAKLYYEKANYKDAFDYIVKFKDLNDSMTSLKIQQEQLAFDKKLELQEKNAKIILTREQNKTLSIENEKQRNRLIASIIGMVALIILIVVIYLLGQQKRKNQQLLYEKEKEARQNEILKLLGANEISNMNSFMQGQEKERSRIASDLHDRLGSLLSTVKLHFSAIQASLEESENENSELMNNTINLLDKAVDEVRSVSHNLTKGVITQFGLLAAVETIQEAINETGKIRMELVEAGFEKRLESEVEINLFRVIQEMVNNTIKHAEATEIIIQFVQNEESINIIFEDNGKGFDSSTLNNEGMGLQNMYNRINDIGATYNLDTKPGNGTTYIIELNI